MAAICLFGVLCSFNQNLNPSNQLTSALFESVHKNPEVTTENATKPSVNFLGLFVDNATSGLTNFGGQRPNKYDASNLESPCSSIFQYKKESDDWIGEVKLNDVDITKDIMLLVEIIVNSTSDNTNTGYIRLTKSVKEALNDVLNYESLVYEVIFPIQDPVPKIKGIYYNDEIICSGQDDVEPTLKTIKLRKSILSEQIYSNLQNKGSTARPNLIESRLDEITCGTPVLRLTQSLVIGGKAVSRGQWPWLVAFYRAGRGKLEFICGGNLISKTHIITAAHCIQDKQSYEKREVDTGVVYVGKHNLDNWNEKGSQSRRILRFIIHEEWKTFEKKYNADIAIIVMDAPVEYSQYIRPICIWEFSDDLNDVIGQKAILAGWGLNENFVLNSEFPKMIEVSIVSEGTCFRSFPALLPISSDRTFCAGGKKDEGPCRGDSGGGLLLKRGDRWYLRGLVSSALRTDEHPCVPESFSVFTDVAKFMNWIRTNTQ